MGTRKVKKTRVDGVVQHYHLVSRAAPHAAPELPPLPGTVTSPRARQLELRAVLAAARRALPHRTVELKDFMGNTKAVQAGDLDSAEWFLVGGNCHSLAAALHQVTGYPIVAFYKGDNYPVDDDEDEYAGDTVDHFAVLTPDGYVLDGTGAMKLDVVEGRTGWSSYEVGGIPDMADIIDVEEDEMERSWQPVNTDLVASFVAPVLARYRQARAA